MDQLCVEGGVPLSGEVRISGAKNAALPIMCATLLCEGEVVIGNVPRLRDVETTLQLLRCLGVKADWVGDNTVLIDASNLTSTEAPYELVKTMRASVLVLGPMLGRYGLAKVSLPGGCSIGARPIDQHLKAVHALGAEVELVDGYVIARAEHGDRSRLVGADVYFDIVTVTGTENAIMAAVLADGETVIHNAACEPEVVDLANFLIAMGAEIIGAGTNIIKVVGVRRLGGDQAKKVQNKGVSDAQQHPYHHCHYRVMPDRIEAGTYLAAGAITGGRITLMDAEAGHMDSVLDKLREMGAQIDISSNGNCITIDARDRKLHALSQIVTSPYPGVPTDTQAQLMALECVTEGDGCIIENIFENRFMHVAELNRMNASICVHGNQAMIKGGRKLLGARVMATDLRASAGLVLAGLMAEGVTTIDRVYHLDRGYENLAQKMNRLGAKVWRISA